jgi:hypothetical protein
MRDDAVVTDLPGVDAARTLLVGREVAAVCFVRDYVEVHFEGPIVRAISNPFGMWGQAVWRFPERGAPSTMLKYIGLRVDDFEVREGQFAQLAFGEHSFTIPLDDESRTGPEALHVVGTDVSGRTASRALWVW